MGVVKVAWGGDRGARRAGGKNNNNQINDFIGQMEY